MSILLKLQIGIIADILLAPQTNEFLGNTVIHPSSFEEK